MTSPSSNTSRLPRILLWICLALLLLVATGVTVVSLSPKRYFAAATIEVKEDGSSICSPYNNDYYPQFVEMQMRLLRRREVLMPVVDRLDLGNVFANGREPLSSEDAYTLLLRSMDLRADHDKGLIHIGVYSSDPKLAAKIANTIPVVYREKRIGAGAETIEEGFARREAEIQKRAKEVAQAAAETARLRTLYGITDPDPDRYDSEVTMEESSDGDATVAAQIKKGYGEYIDAKSHHLQHRELMEMAHVDLRVARTFREPEIVAIRERAEPPREPVRAWLRWRL